MSENIKEPEKKGRGRPKKEKEVDKPYTEQLPLSTDEIYREAINDIQKKIEELDAKMAEKKKLELGPTLADNNPYPQEEEQEVDEGKKDFKMEETKEDVGFFRKLFKKDKMKKEGKVTVILLHHSTDADIHYVNIEDEYGTFRINNEKYNVNEHCVYSLVHKKERYPMCILPTWTMIPIGTKAWFELSQERRGHELERIIINAIKKEEALKADEGKKKKVSSKAIWIMIAIVVIGYIFLKSRGAV